MKVLVTGGAGFIGSHVTASYLDLGHEVIVVDNLSTGHVSNLDPRAKFYQIDIRDPGLAEVFRREQPQVVNHHAAQMNVRRSVSDPIYDAQVNIVGSLQLIECAKAYGVVRFIYISTGGAVYGEPEYLPCDENHPINPICQYGASKHTVEHYLYMYHENYGLASIVLRYPNVYGPRQDPHGEAGVVAIFTGQMLAGDPITINGDGEQTRDYVYVGDCERANVMALDTSIEHDIINLGSSRGTSVNEIFGHLSKLTDFHGTAHNGPAKVGETRHIYLDATRALKRLGWQPEVSLEEGLARTVEYFRETETLRSVSVHPTLEAVAALDIEFEDSDVMKGDRNGKKRKPDTWTERQVPRTENEISTRIRWIEKALSGHSLHTIPLAEILKATIESTGGKSGSILILDDEGKLSNAVISFNDDIIESKSNGLEVTLQKGLAGWVHRKNHAALVQDTSSDPRWHRTSWEQSADTARSAISVPLIEDQQVRGILTITHPQRGNFTKDDLALLLTASTLLTINNEHPVAK